MPDVIVVLAVLVAALFAAAVAALLLGDRAAAPAALPRRISASDVSVLQATVRAASRRGMGAVGVAIVTLAATTAIANGMFRDVIGDMVFAAPLVAGISGVGLYALLQARRLPTHPAGQASLVARRVDGFASTRSFITMSLVVALLVAVEVFALLVTPTIATFTGPGAVTLLVLIGALVAAEVFGLRQIAVRAALPTEFADVDLAIRQIATRFVLLLSASAMLATAALIALQSGGWLFNNGPVVSPNGGASTAVGALVATIGLLCAIGALAAVVGAARAAVKHARSAAHVTTVAVEVAA